MFLAHIHQGHPGDPQCVCVCGQLAVACQPDTLASFLPSDARSNFSFHVHGAERGDNFSFG